MDNEKQNSNLSKLITLWLVLLLIIAAAWGGWKFKESRTVKVYHLRIATTSPAVGQTVPPTQRMTFVAFFERQFKDKGIDAAVTTQGESNDILTIQGKAVNESLVLKIVNANKEIQSLREMGFKQLVVSNSKASWHIDLRN